MQTPVKFFSLRALLTPCHLFGCCPFLASMIFGPHVSSIHTTLFLPLWPAHLSMDACSSSALPRHSSLTPLHLTLSSLILWSTLFSPHDSLVHTTLWFMQHSCFHRGPHTLCLLFHGCTSLFIGVAHTLFINVHHSLALLNIGHPICHLHPTTCS